MFHLWCKKYVSLLVELVRKTQFRGRSLLPVKEVPKKARCGPEGSRRFRLPDFHDIRHMMVVRSSAPRTGRLYSQECSWYSFSLGAEPTPGPRCGRKEMSLKNPVTSPVIDPGTVRLVAQRLNHYASPDPSLLLVRNQK